MFCKICSDISIQAQKTIILRNSYRFYQTHYDVLNLPRNCTTKEIRSAFIKLSKEHHPDINKSKKSHARFQQINEAYKVLGKSESRRMYDLGLTRTENRKYYNERYYEQPFRNPYSDPSFWANRDRTRDDFYRNEGYYGYNGIPPFSNGFIVMICIFFAFIGAGFQYLAVTRSVTFRKDEMIRRSLEAEKIHKESRDAANENGNVAQLEALKIKLLGNETK